MNQTRRRSRRWLPVLFGLLAGLAAPIANVLGNELPDRVPGSVVAHATPYFFIIVICMLILELIRFIVATRPDASGEGLRRRHRKRIAAALTVLTGLLGSVGGLLSGWVTPALPEWVKVSGPWLFVGFTVILLVAPEVGAWRDDRAALEDVSPGDFLRRVGVRLDDYLVGPLQLPVRATLTVEDRAASPAPSDEAEGGSKAHQTTSTLSPDETLLLYYERAGERLVILGAAGSGKTTQLHLLGRDLVRRAQQGSSQKTPVVLDLSTWADNRDPFARWLKEAIVKTYKVTMRSAGRLVDSHQFIALLDAPDVMEPAVRARCFQAVNEYSAANRSTSLVVCCRTDGYEETETKLTVERAVALQPLSDDAIFSALAQSGPHLGEIATVAANDISLRDALRTPLLLNMVILTQSALSDAGPSRPEDPDDPTQWSKRLFRRYVAFMLGHPPGEVAVASNDTPAEVERALAWLAYQLQRHGEATFYPERLHVDWLPSGRTQRVYQQLVLASALGGGVAIGLCYGLINGAVSVWLVGQDFGVRAGIIATGLASASAGVALFGVCVSKRVGDAVQRGLARGLDTGFAYSMLCAALGFAFAVIAFGLVFGPLSLGQFYGSLSGLATGMAVGSLCGLLVGAIRQLIEMVDDGPLARETISRSLNPLRGFSLMWGLLTMVLLAAVSVGLIGNEAVGPGSGRLPGSKFVPRPVVGVLVQALVGLGIGFISGFVLGGAAFLRSGLLQRTLRQVGILPSPLAPFLTEAATFALLRRVGDGYQFVPQLLFDYFASLDPPPDN